MLACDIEAPLECAARTRASATDGTQPNASAERVDSLKGTLQSRCGLGQWPPGAATSAVIRRQWASNKSGGNLALLKAALNERQQVVEVERLRQECVCSDVACL